MKKISIVVQSKDVGDTLKSLADAGVLHVEHQNAPVDENILMLEEKLKSVSRAIEALREVPEAKAQRDPYGLTKEIISFLDTKDILEEGIKNIKKDIEAWKEWGDFDPRLVYDLEDRNIWVRLCRITKKQISQIPKDVILGELFRRGNIFYCALISKGEIPLPFATLELPEQRLKEMELSLQREERRLEEIDRQLEDMSKHKNRLVSYKTKIMSLIEFNKVSMGMGSFESLSYVRGYCPVYNVRLLEERAGKEKWALVVEDPMEDDNVPTLIRNPRWIEIIRPVFKMINTIPGYKEVDISLWFLLFFSVFFGMLVGDAGYGLVFFIANLFCHIRFKAKVKNHAIFFLTYVLSICAVAWGALTGTFFGQAWLPQHATPLLPLLRENANVQGLCFFIGALHLSVAHIWKFIRKMPSIKALSEAGWICMLWSAYFIAGKLILGEEFPKSARWLLVIGPGLIVLCTNPSKNIFKTIGSGIGGFLLNVVNSFTDVVSYIRLFAVGAATVAVADAFNQLASGIGHSSILTGFLTAFVLLFGHTLNILLGAMAILVHGVRLNVLEFSSHLNMEWSGVEYAPFKTKGD